MTDRYDVAVIGAGLAGLTAASTGARLGARVVVLDQRAAGGRARTTERSGFRLNEGAHALYAAGPGQATLRDLGVRVSGSAPTGYETWWEGRRSPLPTTPVAMARSRLLSVRSKAAAARTWSAVAEGRAHDADGLTFGEWMDRRRLPSDLRRLFDVFARTATYAAKPSNLAANAVIGQLALAGQGVLYLDDGWQAMVVALRHRAEELGAVVVEGRTVTAVGRDGAGWVVETANGLVAASSVVLATGGPGEAERLVGRQPGWTECAGPALAVACLDLGLRSPPAVRILLSADDPLYFSVHSPPASRLAPRGRALASLLRYVHPDEELTSEAARAELDRHVARAGVERDEVDVERFLHRMTVAHGSPVPGPPRPRGDELAGEGIFVAGDWVGEHLLADAAIVSGAAAGANAAQAREAVA